MKTNLGRLKLRHLFVLHNLLIGGDCVFSAASWPALVKKNLLEHDGSVKPVVSDAGITALCLNVVRLENKNGRFLDSPTGTWRFTHDARGAIVRDHGYRIVRDALGNLLCALTRTELDFIGRVLAHENELSTGRGGTGRRTEAG